MLFDVDLNEFLYIFYVNDLHMGFPKQEYWSGLPWPPPADLPDTGVKHVNKKVYFLQLYHEEAVLLETKIQTKGKKEKK